MGGERARLAVVALFAFFSVATPAPRTERGFPFWKLERGEGIPVGCARLTAWISKSGKEGAGLSIRAVDASGGAPGGCAVEITAAELRIGSRTVAGEGLPRRGTAGTAAVDLYVPFVFDNEASWNAGERTGSVRIVGAAGGVPIDVVLPARHEHEGYHRDRHGRQP